jgi:hypothetical protein
MPQVQRLELAFLSRAAFVLELETALDHGGASLTIGMIHALLLGLATQEPDRVRLVIQES